MIRDDASELINQLKAWVEEHFQSLQESFYDKADKSDARTRYRQLTSIIHQLQQLGHSIPEDVGSEKEALEAFLHTEDAEKNRLVILSGELSSLARDINHRLREFRRPATLGQNPTIYKRLHVEFPDGTIIDESNSTNTFVDSIRHIGLQRVSAVSIYKDGVPLVSTQAPESPRLARKFREIEGYFINTHSGTNAKARYIQRIAEALRLDISVRIID